MNQREGFWKEGSTGGNVSYHSALFEFLMAGMQMSPAN